MTGAVLATLGASSSTPTIPDGTVLFSTASTFSGGWSYTIPAGVSFIWIDGWGPGGAPGTTSADKYGYFPGPGAGAGGYFRTHAAVVAGYVFSGVSGMPGTMSVGGSYTVSSPTTLLANATAGSAAASANGGGNGQTGTGAGAGGTASGGSLTNTTGHAGGLVDTWDGGGAPPGLVDNTVQGATATFPGGGCPGGNNGVTGANGQIIITAKSS